MIVFIYALFYLSIFVISCYFGMQVWGGGDVIHGTLVAFCASLQHDQLSSVQFDACYRLKEIDFGAHGQMVKALDSRSRGQGEPK